MPFGGNSIEEEAAVLEGRFQNILYIRKPLRWFEKGRTSFNKKVYVAKANIWPGQYQQELQQASKMEI
jgi:hypothetical protein